MKANNTLYRKLSFWLPVLLVVAAAGQLSCIVDNTVGSMISTGADHVDPPPAPPTYLSGQLETADPFGLPGETVEAYIGTGAPIAELTAPAGDDGVFTLEIPGTESYINLWLYATDGSVVQQAIAPEIPAAQSVWDLPQELVIGDQAPQMQPIDVEATTIVLLITGDLRQKGQSLLDLSPGATTKAMEDIEAELAEPDPDFAAFADMVVRVLTVAAAEGGAIPAFVAPDEVADNGSSLNQAFLLEYEVDYTGDGTSDPTTDAWEDAIATAMQGFLYDVCFDPDLIRVVFQVKWEPLPLLDSNCAPRDREKWLDGIDDGDTMNFVGGVHESMVRCNVDPDYEYCATQEDADLTNAAMGNWVPNRVLMYDDGTNGDAEADDGIYTLVLDLPRGMRVSYKYTFGPRGSIWTGTEEWPGNQRLLELFDINGDGMVVRRDNFGDEASNKDRQNLQTWPPLEVRGNIVWSCGDTEDMCCSADISEDGVGGCMDNNGDGWIEYLEVPYDFDGDCEVDRFPSGAPNTPITVPCEGEEE